MEAQAAVDVSGGIGLGMEGNDETARVKHPLRFAQFSVGSASMGLAKDRLYFRMATAWG